MAGCLSTRLLLPYLLTFLAKTWLTAAVKVERKELGDIIFVLDQLECEQFKNANWNGSVCSCVPERSTFHFIDNVFGCFKETELLNGCTQRTIRTKFIYGSPSHLFSLTGEYQCTDMQMWKKGKWYKQKNFDIETKRVEACTRFQISSNNLGDMEGQLCNVKFACKNIYNLDREECIMLKVKGFFEYTYTSPMLTLSTTTKTKVPTSAEANGTSIASPTAHADQRTKSFIDDSSVYTTKMMRSKTDAVMAMERMTRTSNVLVIAFSSILSVYLIVVMVIFTTCKRYKKKIKKKEDSANDYHPDKLYACVALPSNRPINTHVQDQQLSHVSEGKYTALDLRNCPENEYKQLDYKRQEHTTQNNVENRQSHPKLHPVYSLTDDVNLLNREEPIYCVIEPEEFHQKDTVETEDKDEPFYFLTVPEN